MDFVAQYEIDSIAKLSREDTAMPTPNSIVIQAGRLFDGTNGATQADIRMRVGTRIYADKTKSA